MFAEMRAFLFTMNIERVLNKIHKEKGYGRNMLEQCVFSFLTEVAKQVDAEQDVKLDGFGMFKISHVKEHRLAMNQDIVVPAKRVIIFSPDPTLKAYINQETNDFKVKKR